MIRRFKFTQTITKTITYDDSSPETINCYGGATKISDMVEIDRASAIEDPYLFFEFGDTEWCKILVEEDEIDI